MAQTKALAGSNVRRSRLAPFSIQLLKYHQNPDHENSSLLSLFPASYCSDSYDLVSPDGQLATCIMKELDIERLSRIQRWLWIAGSPVPARPLHSQIWKDREIVITEDMDMHLVWTTGKIFIKPLPRFLLEPAVWTDFLCCSENCDCLTGADGEMQDCEQRKLHKVALGFLYSYAALIRHESDLLLAKERYLLPNDDIRWSDWTTFIRQLDTEHIYPDINPRFYHKELQLSRLDYIYYFIQGNPAGFARRWHRSSTFLKANLGWITATTVYIVVVLTSMQVGLATEALGRDHAFQSASYGLTIFSILGPLICAGLVVVLSVCILVYDASQILVKVNRRLDHFRGQPGHGRN